LGWFYYSIRDDPRTAQPLFQSALEIAQDEFAEAAAGTLRCLAENRSPAEALAMKAQIQAHALDSELVENVVADYDTPKE
jgi:DNA integrity scanning protein DisA with diadenylate cyclase activity